MLDVVVWGVFLNHPIEIFRESKPVFTLSLGLLSPPTILSFNGIHKVKTLYWVLDYHIGSNFWKFYLNRTSFTLGEPVSLVKVFRLNKIGTDCFGVQCVDTIGVCTTYYLLAGPACFWCLVKSQYEMLKLSI
jgi:hypothetical protein